MDFVNMVVRFFSAGGAFMFPILAVAAVGAAIAIKRYVRKDGHSSDGSVRSIA